MSLDEILAQVSLVTGVDLFEDVILLHQDQDVDHADFLRVLEIR